jgi:hypothetical protein
MLRSSRLLKIIIKEACVKKSKKEAIISHQYHTVSEFCKKSKPEEFFL